MAAFTAPTAEQNRQFDALVDDFGYRDVANAIFDDSCMRYTELIDTFDGLDSDEAADALDRARARFGVA